MIEGLSDDELEKKLETTLGEERACVAEFVEHLIEFDGRRLGQKRAYGSTFDYCWRKLRLTEGEAYKRIQVARAARKHRVIIEMIRHGSLGLSAVLRLAPHVDDDPSLLRWAVGRSTREIEVKVATLGSSLARARDVIEFVPAPSGAPNPGPRADSGDDLRLAPLEIRSDGQPVLASQPAPPTLPADWEVRLHFTAGKSLFEKLERAKDLSRHKHPEGRIEAIVEDALDALLLGIDRGLKERPAPEREVIPGLRRIPEWVKDVVWKRDAGACAYESEGRRCGSTAWLEYDHVRPFSLGGASDDPGNVRLLCRAHNQLVAPSFVDKAARSE